LMPLKAASTPATKQGTCCCISMTTAVTRTLYKVTCVYFLSCSFCQNVQLGSVIQRSVRYVRGTASGNCRLIPRSLDICVHFLGVFCNQQTVCDIPVLSTQLVLATSILKYSLYRRIVSEIRNFLIVWFFFFFLG
jgi:hypothetical protein